MVDTKLLVTCVKPKDRYMYKKRLHFCLYLIKPEADFQASSPDFKVVKKHYLMYNEIRHYLMYNVIREK